MSRETIKVILLIQYYYPLHKQPAQWQVFKKLKSKAQEQERGIPGYPCTVTVYQWEVCSLATSVAQKTGLCGARGFRGISSTIEKMIVCGIPRSPWPRRYFCAIFSPTQTLIPLVYDAHASGVLMPSIQALKPLRGSLRAFDSAPLNPWFRF